MNFGAVFKAFDAAMALREAVRRFKGDAPAAASAAPEVGLAQAATNAVGAQIEARLTNVVVAALKEAFDRDHARLELERAQLEEERRRAEAAMRAELRRQAADREGGRLRLLAGIALIGWVASVALLVVRIASVSTISRGLIAAAWLLLLASLGAAFTAQGRVSAYAADPSAPADAGAAGLAALWLLVGGLAVAAASLLF